MPTNARLTLPYENSVVSDIQSPCHYQKIYGSVSIIVSRNTSVSQSSRANVATDFRATSRATVNAVVRNNIKPTVVAMAGSSVSGGFSKLGTTPGGGAPAGVKVLAIGSTKRRKLLNVKKALDGIRGIDT